MDNSSREKEACIFGHEFQKLAPETIMYCKGHGLKIFSNSYCRTAKKIWYLFLYSLKNLTNGTKPTTESHIDAILWLI